MWEYFCTVLNFDILVFDMFAWNQKYITLILYIFFPFMPSFFRRVHLVDLLGILYPRTYFTGRKGPRPRHPGANRLLHFICITDPSQIYPPPSSSIASLTFPFRFHPFHPSDSSFLPPTRSPSLPPFLLLTPTLSLPPHLPPSRASYRSPLIYALH